MVHLIGPPQYLHVEPVSFVLAFGVGVDGIGDGGVGDGAVGDGIGVVEGDGCAFPRM